jgi:type IV secretion system protein VirB6
MGQWTVLMASCVAINPAAGPAETMVRTVDCFMQSNVQSGYASLLGPGGSFGYALTIALTLYVAVIGYRLIFGRSSLSMGEMAPRMLIIGALLALTSSWATYQVLVYDVLTDGPEEIATMINSGAGNQAGLNARIDVLSTRMVDLADAWTEFDARVGAQEMPKAGATPPPAAPTGITAFAAPKDSLGPNMLLISALLLVLGSAGVLVVAKVLLGLLLMLGPVFAGLALFPATRGLTLGWGRAAVLMALVPLMAMMTSAGALALLEPLLADMIVSAGTGIFSLRPALTILVLVILMVAVSVQLFRVGRTIVNGWTLSFGQHVMTDTPPPPAVLAVGQNQTSEPMFNERIQSLVCSIERTAQAHPAMAAPNQRSIHLLQRQDADITQSRADGGSNPDRRIARGSTTTQRAPIKPFRNAA